ncbi:SOS response-associated peptidase [Acuticoccus sp.]|uniref:SOS response-associated peptidase n=1 Tax=Acuticoccus sp. TaxID=1904378 RepID=UPI003B51B14B
MCGRYQLTMPADAVRRLFAVAVEVEPFPPRYNIAPTQPVHVVREGPKGRELALMRWGLLPSWVKDPTNFPLLINARAETAADKPAFRNALRRRRVLLPATGFYEWAREGSGKGARKVPMLFTADGPLALAGLAETWQGPNGEEVDTVAILTGEARGLAATVHTRMPLTVPAEAFARWLDPANDDAIEALGWTARVDHAMRPVSERLGNARLEGAGLMAADDRPEPAAPSPEEKQPTLL